MKPTSALAVSGAILFAMVGTFAWNDLSAQEQPRFADCLERPVKEMSECIRKKVEALEWQKELECKNKEKEINLLKEFATVMKEIEKSEEGRN